jgi:WD40 repeat protein
VDDRCTKQSLTALHAAVANDDVEVALLLIADHNADIDVRTSTGKSMQTLMEENGCLNVRKAFPPEFWKHELSSPRHPKAFGPFDPRHVPNHLIEVREDWSVVFDQAAPRVLDVDLLHTIEHKSVICCVKFSHDGKYVAMGTKRLAFIYDVASGENICVLQDENIALTAEIYVRSVCFSPDGKYLATGDEGSLVKVSLMSSKVSFRHRYTNIFRSGISKQAR